MCAQISMHSLAQVFSFFTYTKAFATNLTILIENPAVGGPNKDFVLFCFVNSLNQSLVLSVMWAMLYQGSALTFSADKPTGRWTSRWLQVCNIAKLAALSYCLFHHTFNQLKTIFLLLQMSLQIKCSPFRVMVCTL